MNSSLAGIVSQFAAENKGLVGVNLLFMALAPVQDVVVPHLYGKVIENIQKRTFSRDLIVLVIVMAAVMLGYHTLDWHNSIMVPRFENHIRSSMTMGILNKYDEMYTEMPTGEIISKVITTPHIFVDWFSNFKDYIVPYVFVFLLSSYYFFRRDWVLGMAVLAVLGVLVYAFLSSPLKCEESSLRVTKASGEVHERVEDILRNNMAIYESHHKRHEIQGLGKIQGTYASRFKDTMECIIRHKTVMVPVLIGFIAIFVYRCAGLIKKGSLTVAAFVSLFMMLMGMVGNISWIVDISRELVFNWGTLRSVDELLRKPDPVPGRGRLPPAHKPPHEEGIGIFQVSYKYPGANKMALNETTLHFKKGERTVVTGDVGSGKTTVTKILTRLVKPEAGDAYIDGTWYSDMSVQELRVRVRYIPQNPSLFDRPIIENILYANATTSESELRQLLQQIGFQELATRLHSPAGKNGSNLSGGQRQLVWCLRALLKRPPYLILDEPTSAMDVETKKVLVKLLNHFAKDTTVIIITHDPFLLDIADRVVKMGR